MRSRCTRAVILAAGCGSRVRSISSDKPKCLMDLGGRTILDWILLGLEEAGIRDAIVVTGFHGGEIRRALARRKGRLPVRCINNPRWRLPNGVSLYVAGSLLEGKRPFLLLMSDHLIDSGTIRKIASAGTRKCLLAVDTNLAEIFDMGDATKVRIEKRRPVAIGKKLRNYNAVDCGLFRLDARVFGALETAFKEGLMSLTDGIRHLVESGNLEVLPIGKGGRWIDIDTPRAYRHAARNMDHYLGDRRVGRRVGCRVGRADDRATAGRGSRGTRSKQNE